MTLTRPDTLTDAFLRGARLPRPVDQRRHLEAHRGLHRRGAGRAAAVDAGRHRGGVRPGPRGPARVGGVAAAQAARGLQEGAHPLRRQRPHHRRPDPGRERQEPADGDRGDLRPADGDQPLPQAGAEAARADEARRPGPGHLHVDRDPAAQGHRRDHRALELPLRDRPLRRHPGADGRQRDRAQARQQDRALPAVRRVAARAGRPAARACSRSCAARVPTSGRR